jgi:hypothetical protein
LVPEFPLAYVNEELFVLVVAEKPPWRALVSIEARKFLTLRELRRVMLTELGP